jgi:hypothetical protein
MSFIPTETLNMSQFSLDTGFDSVAGSPDPTYNPRILDGVELGQFFTRQVHHQGRYIDGITVDVNGITLPQGYIFILDPYLMYAGGTVLKYTNHFIWNIDGVDIDVPKWASNYAHDLNAITGETINGRGYRGYKIVDTTSGAKVVKLIAKGEAWAAMGDVYFDVIGNNTAITGTHKSHILIRAIPSADVVGQTVRELNTTWQSIDGFSQTADAVLLGATSQLPASALNKYLIFNRAQTSSYFTPTNPQVGDWIGLMVVNNLATYTMTLTHSTPNQQLIASVYGTLQTTAFMWIWTGIRWVEIPFSSQGLVKLPRA